MKTNDTNNAPAYAINVGHLHVSVWENTSDSGKNWFNTQIVRRYKDGDQWKDSTSFSGVGDLALLTEAVALAKRFVTNREYLQEMTERNA